MGMREQVVIRIGSVSVVEVESRSYKVVQAGEPFQSGLELQDALRLAKSLATEAKS